VLGEFFEERRRLVHTVHGRPAPALHACVRACGLDASITFEWMHLAGASDER
jgi:hypothetical protein